MQRENEVQQVFLVGAKSLGAYADEIIVLSKNMQRYFSERYNRTTCFIPNGIERPKIIEQDLIRREYGLEKDKYILFLGRQVPEKGLT